MSKIAILTLATVLTLQAVEPAKYILTVGNKSYTLWELPILTADGKQYTFIDQSTKRRVTFGANSTYVIENLTFEDNK